MVHFKKAGKVKHLGVCNFTVEQLKALIAAYPDDVPEVGPTRRRTAAASAA